MKKNFLKSLLVLCLLTLVAAAGRAEARVHVSFSVGGPVVHPCPPPVCYPCPPPVCRPCPPPCHARHHFHHRRHHHCPQRVTPPRPASHAHRVHQHRHPVHRHGGGRGHGPHRR